MALSPNDMFDRYRIERQIGQGGMGRVFCAYDTRLRRKVALKVLRSDSEGGSDGAAGRGRLLREAHAAAALDHPNVVSVFDVGEVDGEPFIAMELVSGRSLKSFVGDAEVTVGLRLRWLLDIAAALACAHDRGLVHRDIKPSNIIVRDDGVLKVFDFGIAHVRAPPPEEVIDEEALTVTRPGTFVGTPAYMAPEQIRGRAVDGRTDQFAWGVVAYELLTGAVPWGTSTDVEVVAAILLRPARPLGSVLPELPAGVAAVVDRALSKEPEERFSSMNEVIAALEPFVARSSRLPLLDAGSAPSVRASDEAPTRTRMSAGRLTTRSNPWRVLGPLAAAVVLVLVGAALVRFSTRKPPPLRPLPQAHPVAITELPPPASENASAVGAYGDGMQALRDGALRTAIASFNRALALDPSLSAAHLRLCSYNSWVSPTETREHFQRASQRRATLTEHDLLILDAIDPFVRRDPADRAEMNVRLRAATARFPLDAELALLSASMQLGMMQSEAEDVANIDRAIALDAKYGLAYAFKVQAQAYWADIEGARRTIATCLQQVPSATMCAHLGNLLAASSGRCKDLQAGARQVIASDPQTELGYRPLANASYALGQPLDAVQKTLELAWARTRAEERPSAEAGDIFALAVLSGDFVSAERAAHEMEAAVAASPTAAAHARPAVALVTLYREMGRPPAAARAADDYLRYRAAWVPDPRGEDFAVARDPAPLMFAAQMRAGRLGPDELTRRRAAWISAWKSTLMPHFVPYAWLHGYAAITETPAEAADALAALADFSPIPRYAPRTLSDADVGRVYFLAGKASDAIPFLEAAANACAAVDYPIAHTRANLYLGLAREATGDRDGACDAYKVVLTRWGHAKPRSVSAERARERTKALGCALAGP